MNNLNYKRACIIGAGGQCRVVLSILFESKKYDSIKIYDLKQPSNNERILDIPVVGSFSDFLKLKIKDQIDVYLAIGDNSLRKKYWDVVSSFGGNMPNLISKYAIISNDVLTGGANLVCPNAFIGPSVRIGDNNLINTSAILEHETVVGNHCHFGPGSIVAGRSQISNLCFMGINSSVANHLKIASNTTIGAGAMVIKDIRAESGIYIGTPALRKA